MQHDQFEKKAKGQWVQTERKAHEAWAALIRKSPMAAQVMHILTSRIGEHNAVVISQKNLARLVEGSERGVRDALALLKDDNWIEVRQIGGRGTVNAHIVNDRVAWSGKRDGIRYSLFSASVILSDDEQPDVEKLGEQEPLRRLPMIGEHQIPNGPGLSPPSQPDLPTMEAGLPATGETEEFVRVIKKRHFHLSNEAAKHSSDPDFDPANYATGMVVEYEMVPVTEARGRERG
jgi:hypothetical protein